MAGIDVLLIVIGAILVIVSFFISEKFSGYAGETVTGREIWSDRDEETIKDRINIVLADKTEQIVNDTDDRLCHLSNEKIMEFQEFSDQINEKLNENHSQSVFLYKMLTEKQGEMKEWIAELDSKYAGIKDRFNSIEELLNEITLPETNSAVRDGKAPSAKDIQKDDAAGRSKKSVPVPENAEKRDEETYVNNVTSAEERKATDDFQTELFFDKNERIFELFDAGKSIIDISKQLGIGQGEVKLVLDLYRGNKK